MDEFNKCIKESEEILNFALEEFKKAKKEGNELLGRYVSEKAYLFTERVKYLFDKKR